MSAIAHTHEQHLRLIDPASGELFDECPQCHELQDQLDGAHREIRAWRARYAELKRTKDKEAQDSPHWPVALRVFNAWREQCNHPRSKWDAARFWLLHPFLRDDGEAMCLRAIAGAALDPYITKRKNGTVKRHDGLELIFRDRGKFEEFANRAPRDWQPPAVPETKEGSSTDETVNDPIPDHSHETKEESDCS